MGFLSVQTVVGFGLETLSACVFLWYLVLASQSFIKEHFVQFLPGNRQDTRLMMSLLSGFPPSSHVSIGSKLPSTDVTKPLPT